MIFNLRYLLSSIVASAILVLIFIFPSTYAEADPSVPPPSSACSISPLDRWSAQKVGLEQSLCGIRSRLGGRIRRHRQSQ